MVDAGPKPTYEEKIEVPLPPPGGWPLGSLVCYVLLCFCHFLIWCPGSGGLLDCIDF